MRPWLTVYPAPEGGRAEKRHQNDNQTPCGFIPYMDIGTGNDVTEHNDGADTSGQIENIGILCEFDHSRKQKEELKEDHQTYDDNPAEHQLQQLLDTESVKDSF